VCEVVCYLLLNPLKGDKMVKKEKEDFGDMDQLVENARIELELRYRELKEEIKTMNERNFFYKDLVSIFECEPR
jgi:hypothetical protein